MAASSACFCVCRRCRRSSVVSMPPSRGRGVRRRVPQGDRGATGRARFAAVRASHPGRCREHGPGQADSFVEDAAGTQRVMLLWPGAAAGGKPMAVTVPFLLAVSASAAATANAETLQGACLRSGCAPLLRAIAAANSSRMHPAQLRARARGSRSRRQSTHAARRRPPLRPFSSGIPYRLGSTLLHRASQAVS